MDKYQTKKAPVTYEGGDGPIDVVKFVPFLGPKDFVDRAVETAIGDRASWQRYRIQFPKQIKGKTESRVLDGYL